MSNIVIYNINGEISKKTDLTADGSPCVVKAACMVKACYKACKTYKARIA